MFDSTLHRFLAPLVFAAQAGHAVLNLSLRRIEGIPQHDVYVVMIPALRPLHVYHDIVTRHAELQFYPEHAAVLVVLVWRVDDDATGLNAIAQVRKMIDQLANPGLDRGRGFHVPEGDLNWNGHGCCSSDDTTVLATPLSSYTGGKP
jgi:hypothetical protein